MGAEDRYDLQLGDTTQQQEDEEQEQSSTKPAHTPDSGPTASGSTLLTTMELSGGGEQPMSNTQPSGAVGGLHVPHLSTEGESEDVGEGEGEGETEEREEYLDRVESRLRRLGMKFAMDTDEEDEEVGWHSSSRHEGTPPIHQHGCVYSLTVFSHPPHMYVHTHACMHTHTHTHTHNTHTQHTHAHTYTHTRTHNTHMHTQHTHTTCTHTHTCA